MWHSLYKKLISLYPPSFLERFGESMEQTFDDLYREWKEKGSGGVFLVTWLFTETLIAIVREHISSLTFGSIMKTVTSPFSAALISAILVLPLALVTIIFWFDIQLLQAPLKYALTSDGQQVNMLGRIVMFKGMVLLPVAVGLNFVPVVRTFRSEGKLLAHPANLMLGTFIFLLITMTWGVLFIESVRCGVLGIPYCD